MFACLDFQPLLITVLSLTSAGLYAVYHHVVGMLLPRQLLLPLLLLSVLGRLDTTMTYFQFSGLNVILQ